MKAYAMVRAALTFVALCLSLPLTATAGFGQDVGADVGGGAGIFRPRNPETKKSTTKPMTPVTKPSTRPSTRSNRGAAAAAAAAAAEERVEDLLAKGNEFRDARRFAEAEEAYQGALKIKPRDGRAAYGLGNVYTDQQRWENAEAAYRNAAQWSPSNVDALVALSVVLVQPRTGADNAKRLGRCRRLRSSSCAVAAKECSGLGPTGRGVAVARICHERNGARLSPCGRARPSVCRCLRPPGTRLETAGPQ